MSEMTPSSTAVGTGERSELGHGSANNGNTNNTSNTTSSASSAKEPVDLGDLNEKTWLGIGKSIYLSTVLSIL